MRPDLEILLQAWDAVMAANNPVERASRLAVYQTRLEEAANILLIQQDLLDRMLLRMYPRWVRANLPPGFPKKPVDCFLTASTLTTRADRH